VHQLAGYEHDEYFRNLEKVFIKYGGRPHWGKIIYLDANDFSNLHPKMNDFKKLRDELNPMRRFSNNYLEKIFNV
jgi:FAD/FMN-containing dehydrogenase